MISWKNTSIAISLAAAVGFAGIGTTLAAHHRTIARPQTAKDSLTVKITLDGEVWGKVKVTYKSGSKTITVGTCKVQSCSYKTPHAVKLTATETAVNSATWPFSKWKLATGGKTTTAKSTSTSFKLAKSKGTLTAVYVLAG